MDDAKKESLSQKMSKYDFIRFCVCDIAGISKSKVIPARNASDYIEKGPVAWTALVAMGTHGGCPMFLKECAEGHHGNCVLMPQPETLHEVPWAGEQRHSVASILCETSWVSGVPQDACPRYVARKQLKELEKMGFTLLSGFEHEFILFKEGTKKPAHSRNDFMTTSTAARHESFLFDLDDALSQIGINIATLQTEYSEGQLEVTCKPKFGIQTADETFIFREAVKEIAHQKGFDVNFMSKPSPDVGNGTHFNLSLWDLKGEKNVFYDSADKDKLSDICKYFIGGLIKHAAAITAIASPTVNCYRRIHTEWAAHLKDWGIEDRLGSFRVKNYSPKVTLIENRTAGGACNPYLTTAVTIAAGIDGIKNKIDPPKMYERDAPRLPDSLEEALVELEKDTAIVEALGEEFIRWYVQPKREFELKTLKGFDPKVFNEEWQDKEWEEFSTI